VSVAKIIFCQIRYDWKTEWWTERYVDTIVAYCKFLP